MLAIDLPNLFFGEVLTFLVLPGLLGASGQCPPGHILYIEAVAGSEQLVCQLLMLGLPEVCLLAVEVSPVPLHLPVLFALYPLAFAVAVKQFSGQAVPGDDLPSLVEHTRVGSPAGPVHGPVNAPDLLLEILGAGSQLHQVQDILPAVGQRLRTNVHADAALTHRVEQFARVRLSLYGRRSLQHQLKEIPPALRIRLAGDPAVADLPAQGLGLVAARVLAAALDPDASLVSAMYCLIVSELTSPAVEAK